MTGRAMVGICTLVLAGGLAVAIVAWLSRQRHAALRLVGRGVAAATAAFCGFVTFALVADNLGTRPRLPGVVATAVFAATGVAAVWTAWRSVVVQRARNG